MKILVFGPSGSGKTYLADSFKKSGINAYDADKIKGLSSWYDRQGKKIAAPTTAREALDNHYSFLWSKKFLEKFLAEFKDVFIFGGSGNVFDVLYLFDKIFFLKVDPEIQKERLQSPSRETPLMDFDENEMIIWGDWLEQEAKKRNIPFVDASLTPEEIFDFMNSG